MVRNGRETMVPRCDVVVGDLVLLSTGDEIPADGQLLEATQMQVDESTLTGEPVCRKSVRPEEQDADATFPTNVVLRGTKLLEGHGRMRVAAVGDATENGRVFTEAQIDSTVRTPLNEQLDRLGTLEAGKLADIAVFDTNVLAIDPADARDTKCIMTIFDGKVVYHA